MRKLNRLFTVTLSVTATAGFALYGCQSLWDSQLVDDPNNCVVNKIPCESGFVCDVDTKHCVPEVGDMAGVDASGSGIDGGPMIDMGPPDLSSPDPSPFMVLTASSDTGPINTNFNTIYGTSASKIWIGGDANVIAGYDTAAGFKKRAFTPMPPQKVNALWSPDGVEVWVAGTNYIGSFIDGTQVLIPRFTAAASPQNIVAMWGVDNKNVYFSDDGGAIYATKPQAAPLPVLAEKCSSSVGGVAQWIWTLGGASPVWAVGDNKASNPTPVAKLSADCINLIPVVSSYPVNTFKRIHGFGDTVWLLSGVDIFTANSQIQTITKRTNVAGDVTNANALNSIWTIAANEAWAVGDGGTILHLSTTSGKWESVLAPISKKGTSLRAVWAANANDVYIVGDGGTILKKYK